MRASHILLIPLLGLVLGGCGFFGSPGVLRGKVQDPQGRPLSGVVVAGAYGSTLSAADGRFELVQGAAPLSLRKPRYLTRSAALAPDGVYTLTPSTAPLRVAWDERWQDPAMAGLQRELATQSFAITAVATGDLPDAEVYVLASPAWFTPEAASTYRAKIQAGAKLVLLGEWGGYDGLDLAACNALLDGTGIRLPASSLETYGTGDPPTWITLNAQGPWADQAPRGLRLFTAGALEVSSPGMVLLRSPEGTARLQAWSRGPQVVAAAGPLGRGKVVALSDSSMFTDEAEEGQPPHWATLDNAALARAALNW